MAEQAVTKVISAGEQEERIRNLEQRLAQAEARIAQLEANPRGVSLPPLGPLTCGPGDGKTSAGDPLAGRARGYIDSSGHIVQPGYPPR